ncbi:hypothetical protein [Peterkaempfera griseoplana]|uniref:hypothetical protein n=1 Tax=Peterkaempfera griseoplana TaxID=66896 RepID=UPI0012FF2BD7|nr:hypothetical protein [Peterkaempfera griseoplana]
MHEKHVELLLRALESKIDSAPREAYKELADALLTVADRYCAGRLGQLLDEEQLAGVQPPARRETLYWALSLLLTGGAVAGLAIWGIIPDGAETIVYSVVVALGLTIAFPANRSRLLEVLGAFGGA